MAYKIRTGAMLDSLLNEMVSSSDDLSETNKLRQYSDGLVARCSSCYKFIHVEEMSYEIYETPLGHEYHKRQFCDGSTLIPPRLRYKSHGREGRRRRQAKAVYY